MVLAFERGWTLKTQQSALVSISIIISIGQHQHHHQHGSATHVRWTPLRKQYTAKMGKSINLASLECGDCKPIITDRGGERIRKCTTKVSNI